MGVKFEQPKAALLEKLHLHQGCPIFAMEGRVHAGFHSNLSLHLLISLISSLFSDWRCVH